MAISHGQFIYLSFKTPEHPDRLIKFFKPVLQTRCSTINMRY